MRHNRAHHYAHTFILILFSFMIAACGGSSPRIGGGEQDAAPLSINSTTLPSGQVSTGYSQTLNSTGGKGPVNWSLTAGVLPAGLTMSTGGTISGSPTVVGAFAFTVQAADSGGQQVTRPFSITISTTNLQFTSTALPGAVLNSPYNFQILTAGATGAVSFTISSGTLPIGLSLSSSGLISGTPAVLGTSAVTVMATDASSQTISRQFQITIAPPALTLTTTSLPNGPVSIPYSASLVALGGVAPYSWSIAAGALPSGLSLSSAGAITGTPSATGTFVFVTRVSDAASQALAHQFSITISPVPLMITTASLPSGVSGLAYSSQVQTSGGLGAVTLSLAGGTLPTGLSLAPDGTISGNPTVVGDFLFVVNASDSASQSVSHSFSIHIAASSLMINTLGLPAGVMGVAYNNSLSASGGLAPYSWALASGTLPTGLSLSSGGTITGTPTANGTFSFSVKVSDTSVQTQTKLLSITVNASAIDVSPVSLSDGTQNVAYNASISASGGTAPYAFSVSSGTLPTGLTLSSSGSLSGPPTALGTFSFNIQATDSLSNSGSRSYTVTINPSSLQINTPSLSSGTAGQSYSASLTSSGGTLPVTWALASGSLPNGLNLSSGGTLSGTPTVSGFFTFAIRVSDSASQTATHQFSLTINPAPLVMNTASLPAGQSNTSYSFAVSSSGGTTPYNYSIVGGALPAGLTFSTAGVISGTTASFGTFNVTINLVDASSQSVQRQFSLNIQAPPLQITTSSVPDTVKGQAYSQTIAATGGAPPVTWTITSGALPNGLSLSTAGAITGTASTPGTFTFTVQAADTASQSTTRQFSIVVLPPPLSLDTTSLPVAFGGQGYTAALAASGGTPPYAWASVSGTLPSGLTFTSGGIIDGTTTSTGQFSIAIRVSDQNGQTAQRQFTLTVQPPALTITTTALPDANNGSAYSFTAAGTGGVPPYKWSITSGTLPPGLTFSAAGTFSGTPTQSGQYGLRLTLTDSAGATTSRNLTLNVVPVFRITNRLLYGGITGVAYTDGITVADGIGASTFSLVSGTMAPGLGLNPSTGAITGSPTLEGTYTITVKAMDSAGHADTKTFTFIISPSDSNYGNIGNAYATEGGAADPVAIQINSCQTLPGPASYRLTKNVSATDASTVCFKLAGGVKLDLGGFTVTGRIYMNTDANNTVIFNGTVNCNWADNGSDAGCVNINSDNSVTTVSRVHHLTLSNTAQFSRAMHIEWPSPNPAPAVSLRIYNITSTVLTQPNVSRSFAISMVAPNHIAEVFNNDLTCNADAAGCQAIMCYHVADCKAHHNRINMIQNTTQQDGRAILLDNSDTGEVWNNTITANNSRAVRIRDTFHVRTHDNLILSAAVLGDGAIHLADPDPTRPDDDLDALVDKNTFQNLTGNAIFLRNGFNATVRNNTVQCGGAGCFNIGYFVLAGKPNNAAAGTVSKINVFENPSVILTLPAPQIFSDVQATVTACNSGTVTGPGTITILPTPCP